MNRYDGPQEHDRERNDRRDFSRRRPARDFEDRPRDERGRFAGDDERRFDDDRNEDRDWLLRDEDRFGPRHFEREAPDFRQPRGRFGGRSDVPPWEHERLGRFGPRPWSEWQPQPAAGRSGGPDRGRHFGKGPKGYQRSEQRILEDVNDALERHPEVDASEIRVSCEDGVIVLRGTVESRHAKRLAEECVEDLPGVKDVRNELRTQAAGASGTELAQREPEKRTKM